VGEGALLPLVLVQAQAELVSQGLVGLDFTGQELLVRLSQAVVPVALQEAVEQGF
jgi:hypothetical protein